MRNIISFFLFCMTATLFSGGSLHAQDYSMDQRLQRIERDISTLSRAVYKGDLSQKPSQTDAPTGPLDSNYRISVENRLSAIERQLQQLTGQVEELSFKLNRLQEQGSSGPLSPQQVPPGLSYQAPQANPQLQAVNRPPVALNAPTQNIQNAPIQSSSLPAVQPTQNNVYTQQPDVNSGFTFGQNDTQDYDKAFSALKDGNYAAAQDGFKAFLDTYKDSNLVPNALYWLGETYYVQKQYSDAARIFAQGYQNHPNSNKTMDNLLKLGLSLSGMGKKDDACIALTQLVRKNSTQSPVISRAKQEAQKLGCSS